MNKLLNGKRVKQHSSKFKKIRRFKVHYQITIDYTIIFKSIFLFILNIIFYILSHNTTINNFPNFNFHKNNNNDIENYDWVKNAKEIIDKQLSIFKGNKNGYLKNDAKKVKKDYFSLLEYSKDNNPLMNLEIKENLKDKLGKNLKKDFNIVKNIFILDTFNFGNQIAAFNNLINYCEILGIKKIFLNSESHWLIKNDIKTNNIHISLLSRDKIQCESEVTYCGHLYPDFYYPMAFKPKRRSLLLKDEIKNNLPKIEIDKNDLYIYIRSGDSFKNHGNEYTPAPYCFYQKVLNNFKFNKIFIISMDDKSPIIGKLLSDYPQIQHQLNSLENDIATLINAYNLVNSVSSFTQATISFNDNLINLFEYEVYKIEASILHFHYDIDILNRKFNIYRMTPSENYLDKMYRWLNTDEQRNLLFEEKCINDFNKTSYN